MAYKESIRNKIRWLVITFTLFLSVFFTCLLVLYAWVVEDNIFNRLVQSEANYIEQQYRESGNVVAPRMPFMSLYHGWRELPEHIQLLHKQSPERIEFPLNDDGTIHVKEMNLEGRTWLLVANVSAYEVSRVYLVKLVPWIFLVVLVMVLIAFLLARYLAIVVVNPLQNIASAVAIHRDNEPLQLGESYPDNEIGYLARTVGNSINRLHAALQRESDFSRDVSHELRTPLAILKMTTGRISANEPISESAVVKMQSAVRAAEHTLGVLLALSREESIQTEKLGLLQEVEHCIINHFSLSQMEEVNIDISIPTNFTVDCNKNLLHILLNNLLDNAVNHASELKLDIHLKSNQLLVKNPVTELPNSDVLEPLVKAKSSDGLGQGLYLVRRICEHYQWQVVAYSEDGQFIISITLA